MRVLFLVNGTERSAAAVRVRAFAERLPPDWCLRIAYRPRRKWEGIYSFLRVALDYKPHIVYVMDVAYTGVIAGCLAKRLIGCRLVVDTGDAVYELAKSTGNYSSLQLAMIRRVEQMALKRADVVVVRGTYHKALLEQAGVRRVEFVPDGVALDTTPSADQSLRAELGLGNSLVVGLIGTMSWSVKHRMCYGWDVIEALGLLKDAPVKALLVGDGDGRRHLEERAKDLGIDGRVVFVGRQPYAALSAYLSAMDVCVSTQSNDSVGMVRTTGKLPLYLAHRKYVVATDVGEARRVLPGVGCLLPYEGVRDDCYPHRLAEHLRSLVVNPSLMNIAEQGWQVAKEEFEYGKLTERVRRFCTELVQTQN